MSVVFNLLAACCLLRPAFIELEGCLQGASVLPLLVYQSCMTVCLGHLC